VCVGGEDEDVGRRGRRSGVVAIPRCHVVVWVGCGGRWARRKGLRLVAWRESEREGERARARAASEKSLKGKRQIWGGYD